jgi:hypothetical protein
MMKRFFYVFTLVVCLAACHDDDSFSPSSSLLLTFPADTLEMDTVFASVASSTYTFWVHNDNNDGIRLKNVRLAKRNQTGFRVNIDGIYLDNSNGSQVNDLEIRRKDSLLVFVELTAHETGEEGVVSIEDNLVFTLESGREQKVNLRASVWDAQKLYNPIISRDTTIESSSPIIIYGGLKIEQGTCLTIRNTTLYFHDGPGIDVYGRLVTDSVIFRGDRLDRMFSYLPYDRVSGQWGKMGGIIFHTSSTGNVLRHTQIRNAGLYGIVCDSAAFDAGVLRLDMYQCSIHNCAGTGLRSDNANIRLSECLISNMLGDCLAVNGGQAFVHRCTLAQFYPFNAVRGAALRFMNDEPLYGLKCDSCIITGYDEDVVMGVVNDTTKAFEYLFMHSLLRTQRVEDDSAHFEMILWETPKDSIQGIKHFKLIDEDNLIYDFHLDSLSTAQGLGCY